MVTAKEIGRTIKLDKQNQYLFECVLLKLEVNDVYLKDILKQPEAFYNVAKVPGFVDFDEARLFYDEHCYYITKALLENGRQSRLVTLPQTDDLKVKLAWFALDWTIRIVEIYKEMKGE
jgi:hypothetical protein